MANRTLKEAISVKGTNPQYLIEKIIRTRIYDSKYWKEECFALTAELLVDKAMELRYVGGIYGGNVKPTPFLSLLLKMLQIQPEKDIIIEFIKNEDFKYVRALGAFYMRLVGTSIECYRYLEPLYNDYRKLRIQNKEGKFELLHVDEFIDNLLRAERYCDVILPRLQKRQVLEEANEIELRVSALEDLEEEDEENEEGERQDDSPAPRPPVIASSSRNTRKHSRSTSRERQGRDHRRERRTRSRSRSRGRESNRRHRERSRSRDRREHHRSNYRRDDRERDRDRDRDRREERKDSHRSSAREGDSVKYRRDGDRERSSRKKENKKSNVIEDPEIAEANALRAKLGLAPLRP